MRPHWRRQWLALRTAAWAAVLLPALAASGCSEELGPERMPTTRVVGRVHIRNQPVGGGWLEFFPIQGTVGNLTSARIRADGTFEADAVAIGKNAIQLVNPPQESLNLLPGRGLVFKRQPVIRRDVTGTPVTTLDIDLQDEWLRLMKLRRQSQPG